MKFLLHRGKLPLQVRNPLLKGRGIDFRSRRLRIAASGTDRRQTHAKGGSEHDRLVSAVQQHAKFGPEWATWPDYTDWRDQTTRLQGLGGAWQVTYNLTGGDEPERLSGAAVTASLFPVLGVSPSLGRVFSQSADENPLSVVLAHSVWRRRFGGDGNVIGRRIDLNGRSHTVIGVMPEGFAFPPEAELWVPFDSSGPGLDRGYHLLNVVGRLKADATVDQVQAGELGAVAARSASRVSEDEPGLGRAGHVASRRCREHDPSHAADPRGGGRLRAADRVRQRRRAAHVARGGSQLRFTLRAALGASRGRIVRQLLTESLILALCGAVRPAWRWRRGAWSLTPLLALTTLPRSAEVSLDLTVLLFTLAGVADHGRRLRARSRVDAVAIGAIAAVR